MTNNNASVYSHSGSLGSGLLIVPTGGVIAAAVLAMAYSYAVVYTPYIGYISIVFIGCLAVGLGWSISKLGYVSKYRNSTFLKLAGLGCGLVAVYISWAAYEYALLARVKEGLQVNMLDIIFHPKGVWEVAKALNENGAMGKYVCWGIEALMIVGGTVVISSTAVSDEVFCDDCNQWCGRKPDTARLELPEDENALQDLRPDNLKPIMALESADSSATSFLKVDAGNANHAVIRLQCN